VKTRSEFVANSSSSSFVVIGRSDRKCWFEKPGKKLVIDHNLGETEFGWGPGVCKGYGDRINFAYIQILIQRDGWESAKNKADQWQQMLDNVLKQILEVEEIEYKINDEWDRGNNPDWGYIDHQSSAIEGQNTEIFEDEDTLEAFLFGEKSCIILDNDNH
jgi:hypothetical protein